MYDSEAPARRRIPVARKIVYSCLLAVLCLAAALFLAELGLRIFAHRENIPQREYDPYLGWKGVPNLDCILNERLFKIEIRQNSQGFRDRERTIAKPPGCFRILAVGDSFTWGWGVRQEQIYTNVLERRLSEAGRNAEVINTGVGGYSTDQMLLFLTRSGFQYSPDMVVYQACFNDIPDNTKSLAEGIYRKPRFELTDDGRMELKDCPVPEMGAGARLTYWFSRHSRLLYFLKHRLHLLQAENAPDAPPPSTAPADEVDYAFRLFCALNRKIQEECVSRGIAYVVLIDFELGPARKRFWEADCREVKAFFLKDYLDRRAKTTGRPAFIPHDGHWSAEGHEWVADYLFNNLLATGQEAERADGIAR